jgi:hypothetical protein
MKTRMRKLMNTTSCCWYFSVLSHTHFFVLLLLSSPHNYFSRNRAAAVSECRYADGSLIWWWDRQDPQTLLLKMMRRMFLVWMWSEWCQFLSYMTIKITEGSTPPRPWSVGLSTSNTPLHPLAPSVDLAIVVFYGAIFAISLHHRWHVPQYLGKQQGRRRKKINMMLSN